MAEYYGGTPTAGYTGGGYSSASGGSGRPWSAVTDAWQRAQRNSRQQQVAQTGQDLLQSALATLTASQTPTAAEAGTWITFATDNYYDVRAQSPYSVGHTLGEVFRLSPVNAAPGQYLLRQENLKYYEKVSSTIAEDMLAEQPLWVQQAFTDTAEALGGAHTPTGLWTSYVNRSRYYSSHGINLDAVDLFMADLASESPLLPTGSSSSGGGSYGGGGYGGGGGGGATSMTINLSNKEDARAVIDQLAFQMVGRNVTDVEFNQYYKALLKAERRNPQTVSVSTDENGNPVQTVEGGLGAEGRTQLLKEQVAKSQGYAEYQVGSTALNLMANYLRERGVFGG